MAAHTCAVIVTNIVLVGLAAQRVPSWLCYYQTWKITPPTLQNLTTNRLLSYLPCIIHRPTKIRKTSSVFCPQKQEDGGPFIQEESPGLSVGCAALHKQVDMCLHQSPTDVPYQNLACSTQILQSKEELQQTPKARPLSRMIPTTRCSVECWSPHTVDDQAAARNKFTSPRR